MVSVSYYNKRQEAAPGRLILGVVIAFTLLLLGFSSYDGYREIDAPNENHSLLTANFRYREIAAPNENHSLLMATDKATVVDSAVSSQLLLPLEPLGNTEHWNREQNCPADVDSLLFIRNRCDQYLKGDVDSWSWPQTSLDDKWGFYVFCKANGLPVPEIYMCSGKDSKKSLEALQEWEEPANNAGFVVKVIGGRGARGVFVMESGFGGREKLSRQNMTRSDVISSMKKSGKKFGYSYHVEEILQGHKKGVVPIDYKFHVTDGEILMGLVMPHRKSDLACEMSVNEHFERVDNHGCFVRNEKNYQYKPPPPGQCAVTNVTVNRHVKGGTTKRCTDVRKPIEWDALVETAKKMSRIIGIYSRIDLYIVEGKIFLGEATFRSHWGNFHCQATIDKDGCVDPCFRGRVIKEKNEKYGNGQGGPIPPEPEVLKGWRFLSEEEKCQRVMAANKQ